MSNFNAKRGLILKPIDFYRLFLKLKFKKEGEIVTFFVLKNKYLLNPHQLDRLLAISI